MFGHLPLRAVLAAALLCVAAQAGAQQQSPAETPRARLERVGRIVIAAPPEQLPGAVKELKAILAADPRSAEAHMLLGIAYRRRGSPELMGEVKAELQQAVDLNPALAPARFYLAHVNLDLGRPAKARDELTAALQSAPGHPQFLALLGETERQLGQPQRAVELIQQALAVDASSPETRYYLGKALLDAGRNDEGLRELEAVVQAKPPVVDPYVGLGAAYLDLGRTDDAIAVLERAAALDPARPDTHIRLASAYRAKGLLTKAEAQLKNAAPGDSAAMASGYQQQHVDADFYVEQGLIRLARGQLAAAATAFEKVLDMDASHGPATRGLAQVSLKQGRFARAGELAAQAEKLGAPLPDAERKLLDSKLRDPQPDRRP